jgi:caffeoyl-CoA O-methyltransferase
MVKAVRDGAAEPGAQLFAHAIALEAKRILAVGAGTGHSGMWLARALPHDGLIIVMEPDTVVAAQAREQFEDAGLSNRAHVIPGEPERMLYKLAGPFDLIFQVGEHSPATREKIGSLLRPGGLLIAATTADGSLVVSAKPT